MSEPIKVGDLVQLVRGHTCLMELRGGAIFVVDDITPQVGGGWTCGVCGTHDLAPHDAYGARGIGPAPTHIRQPFRTPGKGSIPLSWLKRIPPLEELEGEKRRKEITA